MNNWYTRKEVAELLGVSKATVYHYAKQKKIIKIEDPHRIHREARYEKEEVEQLAEERKRNEPTGYRPSEIARELNVPVQRIYTLIRETTLPVEQLPAGDERMIYSIPEETAAWIRTQIKQSNTSRGTRGEFYDPRYDIALYQRFQADGGQEMRVSRNDAQEWGFILPSGTWIPYADGRDIFHYKPVYDIHQYNEPVKGYTDFMLPIEDSKALQFLDFIYEAWGIENIRLKEEGTDLALSIKSGERTVTMTPPLSEEEMKTYLTHGDLIMEGTHFSLMSGYRRTTFDLPYELLELLRNDAIEQNRTMSEIVEKALLEKMSKKERLMEIQENE